MNNRHLWNDILISRKRRDFKSIGVAREPGRTGEGKLPLSNWIMSSRFIERPQILTDTSKTPI